MASQVKADVKYTYTQDSDELKLYKMEPDASIDPSCFVASCGKTSLAVSMVLGIDFRYTRGFRFLADWNATDDFTIEIINDIRSSYRPGEVNLNDPMFRVHTRRLTMSHDLVDRGSRLKVFPLFSRKRPDKVWIPRTGNIILSFRDLEKPE